MLLTAGGGKPCWAKTASRHMQICAGDIVKYSSSGEELIVQEVEPRQNCLRRSYGRRSKELAANIDLLLVATAPQPLFNTSFVDRILAAADAEGIPAALVVNKADLKDDLAATRPLIEIYSGITGTVLEASAATGENFGRLEQVLNEPELRAAVLAGVSGVGKSSIINRLVPGAEQTVQEVSARTGQGRQTTTQATGYVYERPAGPDLLLIDLPGIQNFGLTHLDKTDVRNAFADFSALAPDCQFANCMHLDEPGCAVKAALESGQLANSRYESYLEILSELDRFAEY